MDRRKERKLESVSIVAFSGIVWYGYLEKKTLKNYADHKENENG